MRFVISGGGTAGHVNPAIATALELERRGNEVVFIGTPHGPEARLAPAAGLEFMPLEAAGFDRAKITTLVTSSAKVLKSAHRAKKLFAAHRPDAVVGFGGYVSLPVGLAANRLSIPVVIHEQNSVPGLTNRTLAKHAKRVAVTYGLSRRYFDEGVRDRIVVCGNPVRQSVLEGDGARGREILGVPQDATLLVVMGGSLGAKHLNEAILRCRDELLAIDDLYVVHSTGRNNYDEVCAAIEDAPHPRWKVYPYLEHVGDELHACQAIVSRAGASSLAEICAVGVASILVPFPHATDDHQTKNAADLEEAGACIMIADSDLDGPALADALGVLLKDGSRRAEMARAARSLGHPDAAARLADLVLEAAGDQ